MKNYRGIVLFLGDIICFLGGFFLSLWIGFGKTDLSGAIRIHALPLFFLVIIWLIIFFIFNFYEPRHSKPNLVFLRNFGIAATIMLGIGFIFFYVTPIASIAPKTNLLVFEGISLAFVLGWRRAFYLTTMRSFHTRFAIVCQDGRHQVLVDEVTQNLHLGFKFAGTFQSLQEFIQNGQEVDLLIIHKTAPEENELLESILASNIDVISLAEAYESILYKIPVHFIDSQWVIHSIKKRDDLWYRFAARAISITVAILLGLVTLPISLLIIIAIKLEDGGPILYKNDRIGLHGNIFYLYKFRSMVVQAEKNGAEWAKINDPRVTKVGKITRKLHIDEIPQMINVLTGDLTLVGPRPERPEFVAELEKQIPYYFMRHTIKPGFTGWAQIKFRYARSVMDSQDKFEFDLFYIKNRNLFLDIGIILKTIQIIVTH
jgi:exopolysaccharide biosynthesis polyprenyl glycosylphosphotransferase